MNAPSTTSRYRLAAPGVDDVRAAVWTAGGPDPDAVWERMCAVARIAPTATSASPEQLAVLISVAKTSRGVLGTMGHSLSVRFSAYRTLAKLGALDP